jgi:hypothetical protein
MSIFAGSTEFSGAYVGSSAVDAIYVGADKVWPLGFAGVDWVLAAIETATYGASVWDTGYISQKLDTQGRWTGQTNDQWRLRFQRIGIITGDWTVRLYTRTDSSNPDAGVNTGWTSMQVRAPVADSGWSSRDQTWLRADATFSTTSFASYNEDVWEWEYIDPVPPPFGTNVLNQDWKIRPNNTFIAV